MKYLVSIVLVLLMVNYFAQAQSTDTATPAPPSGTAIEVDPKEIKTVVEAGSSYDNTMRRGRVPSTSPTQGTRENCDIVGSDGCNPSPSEASVTNAKGKLTPTAGTGQPRVTPVPATSPAQQTK